MSDDVKDAAFIGSAINKNVGSWSAGKKKKKANKAKPDKKTKAGATPKVEQPTASPSTEAPQPSFETPSEPMFVKSERVYREVQSSSPKAITSNPNRGRQFNG